MSGEYTFSVQFTFTIDLTSKGETAKEVADKLKKRLKRGRLGIYDLTLYICRRLARSAQKSPSGIQVSTAKQRTEDDRGGSGNAESCHRKEEG